MQNVSIVIPVYNSAQWIAQTLTAALQQTYPHCEIIIVNDGSVDQTKSICCDLLSHSKFPWRIIDQPNSGQCAAQNAGWRSAESEWVQFIDSDDLMHPLKSEWQMKVALSQPDDVGFVYSSHQKFIEIDGMKKQLGDVYRSRAASAEHDPSAVLKVTLSTDFLSHWNGVVRKSALVKVNGFAEGSAMGKDIDLMMRLLMAGFRFTEAPYEAPLYWWRQYPEPRWGKDEASARYRIAEVVDVWVDQASVALQYMKSKGIEITREDRETLLLDVTHMLRLAYRYDRQAFIRLLQFVRTVEPKFIPKGSVLLRTMSRLVGYENAEQLAFLVKGTKNNIKKIYTS